MQLASERRHTLRKYNTVLVFSPFLTSLLHILNTIRVCLDQNQHQTDGVISHLLSLRSHSGILQRIVRATLLSDPTVTGYRIQDCLLSQMVRSQHINLALSSDMSG